MCLQLLIMVLASNQRTAMARRSELKGIANSLNGSFVSRNNDFKGYWSIGQLKSFAINNGLISMVFPLAIPEAETINNLQGFIAHRYAAMLGKLLIRQHIPGFWVSEASIIIDFNANAEKVWLHECSTSGEPFQCRCRIIDDSGHDYSSIIYGRCLPHSIEKELKSIRKSII